MNIHSNIFYKNFRKTVQAVFTLACILSVTPSAWAQESPKEEDFSKIMKVSSPEGTLLEVGGLTTLPNGDLGVSTRRGDIFIVENPTGLRPFFRKFAEGLHEVLGLSYKDGSLYCVQRGELTRLEDTNMDGKADVLETVSAWPLSGYYHEYSYGPAIAPDGSFFVSGNVAFGDEEWWRGESRVPGRGWIMHIDTAGNMQPWATGMRSPCGLNMINGELFYTDNQGDWMGTGGLWHVEKGDFTGHPAGLRWTGLPESPVKLTTEQLYAQIDPRKTKDENGRYIKPENVVDEDFKMLYEMKDKLPNVKLPAVWLPHGIQGISTSQPIKIPEGAFGPFAGQILVGDQGQSLINRIFLEKVNGQYQGASFDFRKGFRSGVLRMAWADDGSLFVGETNRGWGSAGEANEGLQRVVWNNKMPFEMRAVRAMPDGFEIEFTQEVDKKSAADPASYEIESFLYKYHPVYGSPPVNSEVMNVKGVKVSDDGMKARIVLDTGRRYYIHRLTLKGVRAKDSYYSLVHPTAYYTLNNIPEGKKLAMSELSTGSSSASKKPEANSNAKPPANATASSNTNAKEQPMTYAAIEPLLASNTCTACHDTEKRRVGPAFKDVAKRNYKPEEIVDLIYNPKPQHWPEYATEMPPMPQVPKDQALKIAKWINTLK